MDYENGLSPRRERSRSSPGPPPPGDRDYARSRSPSSPSRRKPSSKRSSRHSRSRSPLPPPPRRERRSRSRSPQRHFGGGNRENPSPNKCLGVFGLSLRTTERDLRDVFGRYGRIDECTVVIDAQSGRSRGFAFLYFEQVNDAKEAKAVCNGIEIDGRRIRVDFSVTQRAHTPTPGVYMGKAPRRRDDYPPRRRDDYPRRRSPSPRHSRRRRSRSRSHSPAARRYAY